MGGGEKEGEEKTKKKRKTRKGSQAVKERKPRKKPGEEGYDPYDFDSEGESQEGQSLSYYNQCFTIESL